MQTFDLTVVGLNPSLQVYLLVYCNRILCLLRNFFLFQKYIVELLLCSFFFHICLLPQVAKSGTARFTFPGIAAFCVSVVHQKAAE